jgi:XTP/dITP diphosphohydrolase
MPQAAGKTLVLATANRGKVEEMTAFLGDLPLVVRALAEFPGVSLPPEGERSYVDNALAKARVVTRETGHWALADDSGLEVDALGGGPGVVSARYGGEGLDDAGRCRVLLTAIAHVPAAERTARFRSVIALCRPGAGATVDGVVEGVLLTAPRGAGGFGYDPLFLYPPLEATFAELPTAVKNTVSHRGVALMRAREVLRRWLG